MKNIKLLALFVISALTLNSCIDDDSLTYIATPQGDFEFTNAFLSEYLLSSATSSNLGERFTWSDADFDLQTNVSYDLERSIIGDFSDGVVVSTTSDNETAVTIGDLLSLAEEAGLDNDPETENPSTGNVSFRVRAYPGTETDIEMYTAVQTLTLTILEEGGGDNFPTFRNLFLVGDATAAGWSPENNNTPIVRNPENEDVYSFIGYFEGGGEGFKLLEGMAWQPQWGGENGILAVNDGSTDDPKAFAIAASGYYEFHMNITDMTYTLDTYDASAAATYNTIGIIGDATEGGWDADTDMTQSEFDPHLWYINNVSLGDGELKFRAEDAWDNNWGGSTAFSGYATQDGPNVPVTTRTYNIWFNDLDGSYILIAQE